MISPIEQLLRICRRKRADGLAEVKLTSKGEPASADGLARDLFSIHQAVAAGHTRPLRFVVITIKCSSEVVNRGPQPVH